MTKEQKIIEMGNKLPQGAKKKIAILSGYSQQTVCKYFKKGVAKPETSIKILEQAKPFADAYQKLREAELELLNLFMK